MYVPKNVIADYVRKILTNNNCKLLHIINASHLLDSSNYLKVDRVEFSFKYMGEGVGAGGIKTCCASIVIGDNWQDKIKQSFLFALLHLKRPQTRLKLYVLESALKYPEAVCLSEKSHSVKTQCLIVDYKSYWDVHGMVFDEVIFLGDKRIIDGPTISKFLSLVRGNA